MDEPEEATIERDPSRPTGEPALEETRQVRQAAAPPRARWKSALVAREGELNQIREVLARAVDFHAPQLITVVGNRGTGKTRLVADLLESIDAPTRVFKGHATAEGARYGAIRSMLYHRFEVTPDDAPGIIAAKIKSEVVRLFGTESTAEIMHFLGAFLGVSLPKSAFLRALSHNTRQHEELERTILRRLIEVDAGDSPLVLVFDDLQWADDETLAVLQELGAGLEGSPVVIIGSTRPDMLVRCPDWGMGATDHLRVDLRNLDPDDAEDMFRNLMWRCDILLDDAIDDAVEMTGGNPQLLEQLVDLFLDNQTITVHGERWVLDPDRAAETELPITIEEAIEARIAALEAPERELLEKGAVFGNVFWIGAVVAMARVESLEISDERRTDEPPPPPPPRDLEYRWTADDDPIRRRVVMLVSELVEQDYLLELDAEDSTIPADVEVVFKHNLERELIVNTTVPRKLERYHHLGAQWLEAHQAEQSEEQLEFLGQLYERGGDHRRAAHCFLSAGDRARARYKNETAVELYTRGLGMIEDQDALARMSALHNLGSVLALVGRTDDALERFSEMLRIAWLFDSQAKAGAAHGRLGRIHRRRGEYDSAMEHLREASQLFGRAGDRRGVAGTLDDIGQVHWLRGAYGQALEYHRQALAIRRALGDRRSIALSLANIGRVHRDSGGFTASIAQFREALDLRRDISDLPGVVESLCDLGGVHADDGAYEMALQLFNEAYSIARDIGDKISESAVLSRLGECKGAMGRGQEAVAHLEEAIGISTSLGDRVALSECCRRLAEVYLALGRVPEADDQARRALAISEAVGSRVHVGTAHRVLAEAIAAGGLGPDLRRTAEGHFRKAVDILAGMKNEPELARCYQRFSLFRDRTGHPEDAAKLRNRADGIFGRMHGAASARMGTGSGLP